ncbi:MAG: hypothetical protein LBP76_09565 [Treponema sp.]|jgi:hypothetical protein|nr:hypothetical protein [Treponema sp.]
MKAENKKHVRWNKVEKWIYEDLDGFKVEVVRWEDMPGHVIWNKYLYLFPGNSHFGKYLEEDEASPDVPFDFHCGITYYKEHFNRGGDLTIQIFGDDYNHLWDHENPVESDGASVFSDAENLIREVKEG